MIKHFSDQISSQISILESLINDSELNLIIESVVSLLIESLSNGRPLLTFGNGGSAADALHISAELVGDFNYNRQPLNVICLNSNTPFITAWSNDYEYETIFSRQIKAYSYLNPICLGLSTSGNSPNVVNAFKTAKSLDLTTIALTGQSGGSIISLADYLINVPSSTTPRIQEAHQCIYHYLCERIESHFI